MPDPRRVEAGPEKRFFISMLTKDIELLPAIADLIDNSVDGARRVRPGGNYRGLFVRITMNGEGFRATDNCGGIDADIARRYAFRFGRPAEFPGIESSVGQFGVGMKRALFKLGKHFVITSTAANSRFSLTVDVDEWEREPSNDWTFEFDEVQEGVRTRKADRGTDIHVDVLHDQVAVDFGLNETGGRLRQQVSLQHQEALAAGLRIDINGTRLRPSIPSLLVSEEIQPINYSFDIPVNGSMVSTRIVAGIAEAEGQDDRDEGEAESFREPPEAGWYVFCNDRLVLAADKSPLTGWGRVTAAYHPQYRRFRGYAFLQARDSSLLPLNTTKTGLDEDSPVFRSLQQAMFSSLSSVAAVINRLKTEVQQKPEGSRPLTEAFEEASDTNLKSLPVSKQFDVPPPPPHSKPRPSLVTVSYKADRRDMKHAMEYSGLSSASKVGQLAFEFYLAEEVEPNDA